MHCSPVPTRALKISIPRPKRLTLCCMKMHSFVFFFSNVCFCHIAFCEAHDRDLALCTFFLCFLSQQGKLLILKHGHGSMSHTMICQPNPFTIIMCHADDVFCCSQQNVTELCSITLSLKMMMWHCKPFWNMSALHIVPH